MTWHPKDTPSEREKFIGNMQRAEISGPMPYAITCGQEGCDRRIKFIESYQCYFCKIWYCEHCAATHFNKESNHAAS